MLLWAVLAAYCCLYGLSSAAVISIDFGSEWIKVALVKVSMSEPSEPVIISPFHGVEGLGYFEAIGDSWRWSNWRDPGEGWHVKLIGC